MTSGDLYLIVRLYSELCGATDCTSLTRLLLRVLSLLLAALLAPTSTPDLAAESAEATWGVWL